MIEPITTTAAALFLGTKALEIIGGAAKDHAKGHVKGLLASGEKRVLGDKERDALEDAYQNALAHAYARALEALGNVLNLTVSSGTEFVRYRVPVERFLKNGTVAAHLLDTVRDLSDTRLPDPGLLEREWNQNGGEELPIPGVWHLVAANFRKGAQERTFITPQLREVLNARTLTRIMELQQLLRGVQITVKHEQYVSVMRKTYARVDLARIAPPTADDPGTLIVTDIFEPQHVRENPPPVEITKDELEKLACAGKLDGSDEEAIIALLVEDGGQDFAQRVKFQRASYAEQPVRPVLDVISSTIHSRGGVVGGPMRDSYFPHSRLLVITGEPGSGKTTLLRYLLLSILDPPPDPDDPSCKLAAIEKFTIPGHEHFPLLIELREYHFTCEKEKDVNSIMDYARYLGETMGYGIDDEWLDQRLKSGLSLIMFDGLDEIFDPARRDQVIRQIVGFSETYPLARVIVTSRPHGYHEGILRPAGFAHYRLQDLDRQQKENFTRAWFSRVFPNSLRDAQQRIDRVLNSVDRSPSVRWLAGNPLLLTIMCLIARERELPEERAEFYEQCLDVLVHQWAVNNHLQMEDLAFLSVYRKKELLRKIAFEMQASRAGLRGNFIGEEQLLAITRQWFEENYDDLKGSKAEQAAQRMVQGLWQRNYVLCPRGPKLYGFLHRTFMEFLTAREYVRRFEKTDDFTLDDLDAVFREHGNDPEWSEVLRLICGEIGDEYADRLIRTLLTLKEFPERLDKKNAPHHFLLAIRCMGELRGLSKMEELGVFALKSCLAFLTMEVRNIDISVTEVFADVVGEIGPRWAGRNWLETRDFTDAFRGFHPGTFCFPEFEAAILRDKGRARKHLEVSLTIVAVYYRCSAIRALARYFPDDETRQLLVERAVEDSSADVRSEALALLAGSDEWADDASRQLLTQCSVEDTDPQPRWQALSLLAGSKQWADDATRQLLSQRAVEDKDPQPRSRALELLAGSKQWADGATRQLLSQRAVEDKDPQPRSRALELLAGSEQWADDATRQLLSECAVKDESPWPRSQALALLTRSEQWADDATRQLLSERAVKDKAPQPRSQALALLTRSEQWADDATRQLLSERAVIDDAPQARSQALALLAGSAQWADDATRQLLSERAVIDNAPQPRSQALALLARSAQWVDDTTRQLLTQLAIEDRHPQPRGRALALLARSEQWAVHEDTLAARQRFLQECVRTGAEPEERGRAACFYFRFASHSDPLADAKRRVFSRNADGSAPFLDPHEPISDEHLARVSEAANLTDQQRDEMVAQIDATLGWDIRKGLSE
jgi:hypothetical protein